MAHPTPALVLALRQTAARLEGEVAYQWGHMGECNCGHLVQTVTGLTKREIHQAAMDREGDWQRQAIEYCPDSGRRIDDILTTLIALGMGPTDVARLEWLSDPAVLARVPPEQRPLRRNDRGHVVLYMRTLADLLDEALELRGHHLAEAAE